MAVAAGGLRAESVPWLASPASLASTSARRSALGAVGPFARRRGLRPFVAAPPRQRVRPWPGVEPAGRLTAPMTIFLDPPPGLPMAGSGRIWSATSRTTSCMPSPRPTASRAAASSATTTTSPGRLCGTWSLRVPSRCSSRVLLERLDRAGLRRRKATPMARRALGNPPSVRPDSSPATWSRSRRLAGPIPPDRLEAGSRGCAAGVCGSGSSRTPSTPISSDTSRGRTRTGPPTSRDAWMDDEVAAVIAGRGGYGTQRMLDLLDWRRLAEAGRRSWPVSPT